MNQQEMTAAWNALESRVAKYAARQVELEREQMGTLGRRMRRLPTWDLAIAGLTVLWVGNFVADHFGRLMARPVGLLPALLLFAFAIVEINLSVRHLIVANELDLGKPIVEAQRNLANLRKLRVKVTQWLLVCALPAWLVFPMLLGQSIFGVDFVFALNPAWVVSNIVFGIAMAPLVNWVLRKSRFASSLTDTIVGKDIARAEAFLEEIREFQND